MRGQVEPPPRPQCDSLFLKHLTVQRLKIWPGDETVTLIEAFIPANRLAVAVFTVTQLTGPAPLTFWGMGWKLDCITFALFP